MIAREDRDLSPQALSGALPAIVVEHFSEERPLRSARRPSPSSPVSAVRPPGYDLAARLASTLAAMQRDYARTIGTHRDFHPRFQSRVEHRIDQCATDALASLSDDDELDVSVGPLRLTGDLAAAEYDAFEHEHRVPCRLHLPWSWPRLPMWFAVAEVSTASAALRLSLRSRRRVRYPVRYFHAAHAVLTALELRLR